MRRSSAWMPSPHFLLAFVFSGLMACGPSNVQSDFTQNDLSETARSPDFPSNPTALPVSAYLRNTHYYTLFEEDYSGAKTEEVLSKDGNLIARVTPKYFSHLVIEGSGKLADGRVINWAGEVNGKPRFYVTPSPWGIGTRNCKLEPFRSVAVDRRVIPLGTLIYIDETKGMFLPNGKIHDGYWRAEDTGGAILRDRVDLFIGRKRWNSALSQQGIGHLQPLTVRIVQLPNAENCASRP
jgi:3D (Asp-Asp-Asp) domain-containing protein